MQDAGSGALRIKNMTREGKKARKYREDEKKNRVPGFADCHGVLLDSRVLIICPAC